jgi:hypothetical protein
MDQAIAIIEAPSQAEAIAGARSAERRVVIGTVVRVAVQESQRR